MGKKMIIDTDAGLDDAAALFLAAEAHKSQKLRILAVTAVHGNTTLDNVLRNICRTLDVAHITDVPVYKGAHSSLVETFIHGDSPFHGHDGFGNSSFNTDPDLSRIHSDHAVLSLTRLVREHPGDVTLVALGPLTNIAMAIRFDPEFINNVKELYIMGGNTEGVGNITVSAEFNFHCDPEAAHIVLRNIRCPTYIVPWELCLHRTKIDWDWRRRVYGAVKSPQAALMNTIEAECIARPEFSSYIVCDQLAMAAAIDDNVVLEKSPHYALVELNGKYTRRQMVVDYGRKMQKPPNVHLIDQINMDLFKRMLLWSLGDLETNYSCPET